MPRIATILSRSLINFPSRSFERTKGPLFLSLFCCRALIAQTKLAEPFPRKYSVVVTIAKHELHSVAANMLGAEHRQIVGDGSGVQYAQSGDLADAIGAHAF